MNRGRTVAIVGGGFCGIVAAVRLLRETNHQILLFEGRGQPRGGRAYGGDEPVHWLNVPAARMSAFPEFPNHFVEWLGESGRTTEGGFALRTDYGQYLRELLSQAEAEHPGRLRIVPEHVESIVPGSCVRGKSGTTFWADAAILATGYGELCRRRFSNAVPALEPKTWPKPCGSRVVVIGTGLTGMDAAASVLYRNPQAQITLVSRRGTRHEPFRMGLTPWHPTPGPEEGSAQAWTRWLRREVRLAKEKGLSWVEVFDAMRHHWDAVWASLPLEEKRRAFRHLRRCFDRHRHRTPPPTEALIAQGDVTFLAACVREVRPNGVRVSVEGEERFLEADLVIDATANRAEGILAGQQLANRLVSEGFLRVHPLGLGVEVSPGVQNLYLVGPLCRGERWESTAVAELREQVRQVCAEIAQS